MVTEVQHSTKLFGLQNANRRGGKKQTGKKMGYFRFFLKPLQQDPKEPEGFLPLQGE